MWKRDLERGIIIATGFMTINLLIGLISTIALGSPQTGAVSGGLAFLEMGLLLILGVCLMMRQPLKDEDRYSEDGVPSTTWKFALVGRQVIFAGIILFVYAAVLAIVTIFYPF